MDNSCIILQNFRIGYSAAINGEIPMGEINQHLSEREQQQMQLNREELVERIARAIHEDGDIQVVQGLHLARYSAPRDKIYGVLESSVCIIAQGSKEILLGDNAYRYDPYHYLLATMG